MMKSFVLALLIASTSIVAFAKKPVRLPSSAYKYVVRVIAEDLKSALTQFASDEQVKKMIAKTEKLRFPDKECSFDSFDSNFFLQIYSGRNGAMGGVQEYLVPLNANCEGTGMISKAELIAKIRLDTRIVEESGKETNEYSFLGFIKGKILKTSDSDQSSGLVE